MKSTSDDRVSLILQPFIFDSKPLVFELTFNRMHKVAAVHVTAQNVLPFTTQSWMLRIDQAK